MVLYIFNGNKYPGVSDKFSATEAAYIFGSVRFQISDDTTFKIVNGQIIVDGKIELQDDAFKHESGNLNPTISRLVQEFLGDDANYDQVTIIYSGTGVDRKIVLVVDGGLYGHCFQADTSITMADGSKRSIENIALGDWVQAPNGLGECEPRQVTKLYRNSTPE